MTTATTATVTPTNKRRFQIDHDADMRRVTALLFPFAIPKNRIGPDQVVYLPDDDKILTEARIAQLEACGKFLPDGEAPRATVSRSRELIGV